MPLRFFAAYPQLKGVTEGDHAALCTSQVPVHRIWGHRAFNLLTQVASGMRTTDSQSGYRAFSPEALEKIDFQSNGFSVESEMQFIAHELGLRLLEVPITIRYLDHPKRSVWQQGLAVLSGVLKLTGQYRPLFYFGLSGIVVMLTGLGLGVWVAERFEQTGQLATGSAILCLSVVLRMRGWINCSEMPFASVRPCRTPIRCSIMSRAAVPPASRSR